MNALVPPSRTLDVWMEQTHVGQLREQGNLWSLVYSKAWSEQGFDLSPELPRAQVEHLDGATRRPVQWFFDNLLPEEGARILLARDAGISEADAFGLLERFGPESAGALTLLSPGQSLPQPGLRALSDEQLSERIRNLPRIPLDHDAPKRMSLAGAQHKLPVVMQENELFEPEGRASSTHLLKPDHERVDDYAHSAINEWFCMRLAADCGLPVPEVSMRYVPEPVYLVRRFDRLGEGIDATRRYALDACQLLSLDRVYKYSQATPTRLLDLVHLARAPAATRVALMRWQLFNLLIGNGDAHLKNLSFLVDGRGYTLAPHYDLLSTAVYRAPNWADAEMVIPMGGEHRMGAIRRHHVLTFGEILKIPQPVCTRLLDQLLVKISTAARNLLERHANGAWGQVLAGEARLLRQIVHGPLHDATLALH